MKIKSDDKKKYRIVFFTHYSGMYGANLALVRLICDMKDRYSIEGTVFSRQRGCLDNYLQNLGIQNVKAAWIPWELSKKWNTPILKVLSRIFNWIVVFPYTFFRVKLINPDIIHINSSITDVGIHIARACRKPCVWHLREFGEMDYDCEYLVSKKYVTRFYGKADKLIAVSNCIKEYYKNNFSLNEISVIYDGVDSNVISNRTRSSDDKLKLCLCGLLKEGKNQIELLNAISLLSNLEKNCLEVYFLGSSDGNYENKLKDFCQIQNIDKIVHFMGYIDNVQEILLNMDIGVITSKKEAFGLVTVEYMMAGLAVIASDGGASPEIVSDGLTGYIYSSGDVKQLCEIIKKFIYDRGQIKQMGYNGKLRANELFSQRNNTDKIYDVYKCVW